MKRFVSMLSAVVFASLLFCFPSLAAPDVISVDSSDQYDSVLESLQQRAVGQVVPALGNVSGSESGLTGQSSDSFVPAIDVQGTSYPYNSQFIPWLDFVSYGQAVFAPTMQNGTANYSLAQVNNATFQVQLSGFQPDNTYDGVVYFQLQTGRASKATSSSYLYVTTQSGSHGTPQGFDLLTDFLVTSLSCKDGSGQDVPVYYSRVLSSDGATFMYTFYVLLQDFYIPASNGVVSTNRVIVDVTFSMASSVSYTVPSTDTFPVTYYALVNNTMRFFSRSFSGTMESGRHTFDGDNRQDIANSQASLSESQHDDLVNGYNNPSGSSAMESGANNVESGVASEESALGSAGSMASDFDYDSVNLSELATAFSLISGWFTSLVTALGSWNMLIMISLTMVVALFAVGYFRNK